LSVRNHVKGRQYEADFIHIGGYGCAFGVRHHAGDPCMPRWNDNPGSDALSAAATSATSATDDGDLPGWNGGQCGYSVPDASASAPASAASSGALRRTRLSLNEGRRFGVAPFRFIERRGESFRRSHLCCRNGEYFSSLSRNHHGEKKVRRFTLLVAAAATIASCAHNPPPSAGPALDMSSPLYGPNFLHFAASANLWEIQSSRLALQVSANPAIRGFAEMILADHTQLAGVMAAAGKEAGVLPQPPEALMPVDQAKMDQLRGTPAVSFDAAYRNMQVSAHQQAIQLFENYATAGDNAVLRAMASQAIPMLQRHLAAAEALPVAPAAPFPSPPLPARTRGERG
jgi:putative membrane protein